MFRAPIPAGPVADERAHTLKLYCTVAVARQRRRAHHAATLRHACVHNDVPYTNALLQEAFRRRPGVDVGADWRKDWVLGGRDDPDRRLLLQIDEYEQLPWERVLCGSIVANAYCVRKGLIRKASFARHVAKFVGKHPTSPLAACVPPSVVIETWAAFQDGNVGSGPAFIDTTSALAACLCDAEEAVEAGAAAGALWVLKPSVANKGAEVTVLKDVATLTQQIRAWPDVREWVLQQYVDRPLTLARRKFHIRLYVLAVGAVKVFMFREALLLVAVHPYDRDDVDDPFSHLTNTCVSTAHDDFKESRFIRLFSELPGLLRRQGTPDAEAVAASVWRQARTAIAHVFHSFRGEFSAFMPLPNAFELFGVDLLVEDSSCDHRVQVLEFNAGPDVKQTGSRLNHVIQDMLRGLVDVVVAGGHFPSLSPPGVPPAPSEVPTEADGVTAAPAASPPPHGWDLVYSQAWNPGGGGGPSIALT